jgi:hypothetical protein
MLSRHIFGEPTPPGGVRPGEQVLPRPQLYNEHSHLLYTAKPLLAANAPR